MGRAFGFLGTIIVLGVGMYIYSTQLKGPAAGGAESTAETANIVGVKNDLISIANAERGSFASQQKYVSLDELIAGHYLTIERQREPYTYDVQTTSSGFHVTATRNRAGSPAQLWIDEGMEIKTSD
ncbi:MAG TPA: hypothetical protein VNW47_15790 [Terriglobales bacterium]|jgi:hypothetical protein|nr:hypothetical protein [Terriglobales bacterium]